MEEVSNNWITGNRSMREKLARVSGSQKAECKCWRKLCKREKIKSKNAKRCASVDMHVAQMKRWSGAMNMQRKWKESLKQHGTTHTLVFGKMWDCGKATVWKRFIPVHTRTVQRSTKMWKKGDYEHVFLRLEICIYRISKFLLFGICGAFFYFFCKYIIIYWRNPKIDHMEELLRYRMF